MAKVAVDAIQIVGLREFRLAIKNIDEGVPVMIRHALNKAAEVVLVDARGRTPSRSGRARRSERVSSTQQYARISAGGSQAPYFGALDYGNKRHSGHGVGRGDSGGLPFIPTGRILYPAFQNQRVHVSAIIGDELTALVRKNGLSVR